MEAEAEAIGVEAEAEANKSQSLPHPWLWIKTFLRYLMACYIDRIIDFSEVSHKKIAVRHVRNEGASRT